MTLSVKVIQTKPASRNVSPLGPLDSEHIASSMPKSKAPLPNPSIPSSSTWLASNSSQAQLSESSQGHKHHFCAKAVSWR